MFKVFFFVIDVAQIKFIVEAYSNCNLKLLCTLIFSKIKSAKIIPILVLK